MQLLPLPLSHFVETPRTHTTFAARIKRARYSLCRYVCACASVCCIVVTKEGWELGKGHGTINKYRCWILVGARQGGNPVNFVCCCCS